MGSLARFYQRLEAVASLTLHSRPSSRYYRAYYAPSSQGSSRSQTLQRSSSLSVLLFSLLCSSRQNRKQIHDENPQMPDNISYNSSPIDPRDYHLMPADISGALELSVYCFVTPRKLEFIRSSTFLSLEYQSRVQAGFPPLSDARHAPA